MAAMSNPGSEQSSRARKAPRSGGPRPGGSAHSSDSTQNGSSDASSSAGSAQSDKTSKQRSLTLPLAILFSVLAAGGLITGILCCCLHSLTDVLKSPRTAVVIVDFQFDFMEEGESRKRGRLAVSGADDSYMNDCNEFIDACRKAGKKNRVVTRLASKAAFFVRLSPQCRPFYNQGSQAKQRTRESGDI